MELEVVYSGALDRLGLCPSLSTYIGGSSANAVMQENERPVKASPVASLPEPIELPSYGAVKRRIRGGYSLRSTARFFKIRLCDVRRLLRKADVEAAGRALRASA